MKTTTLDFKKWIAKVQRAARDGKADRALGEVKRMLAIWPDHPRLLLLKATLIQLSENGSLTEAKRTLKHAAASNEDAPEPLIELGYFLLHVEDRRDQAEPIFDRAIELSLRLLLEAVRGKVEAVAERSADDLAIHDLIEQRIHDLLASSNGDSREA